MDRYDLAVIGGGILGLATAYEVLNRRPELRLAVLEKESELALHQSGRNSGVVHSGIYYTPGSLKARLCTQGKALLERFASEHGVPYERPGKLIVAVHEEELGRLATLKERAIANGVEGIREIGSEEIRELEPHAAGIRALHSPTTGIIDFRRVALALADEIRGMGGDIRTGTRLLSIAPRAEGRELNTDRGPILAGSVVSCAGLQSDRVAAMSGRARDERIVPFRGSYYRLVPEARSLVRGLVYPVPDPRLPFLGVHLGRRIDGEVWAGPSAVLALAREGLRRWRVSPRDLGATLGYPGFWRLARTHWRTGIEEISRDLVKRAFAKVCRQYIPELRNEQLLPGPFGVRAQAVKRDGSLQDDFSLRESDGIIHVRNAPSPAATASLAIGRYLTDRILPGLDQA